MKLDYSKVMNKAAAYGEIYQPIACSYAFCVKEEDTVYPLFKPVICREFLTDLLGKSVGVLPSTAEIYGFEVKKDCMPKHDLEFILDVNRVEKFSTDNFVENLKKYLNPLLSGEYGDVLPTDEPNKIYVRMPSWWGSHTILLSWITALFRACCVKNPETNQDVLSTTGMPWKKFMAIPDAFKQVTWQWRVVTNTRSIHSFHSTNGHQYAALSVPSSDSDSVAMKQFKALLSEVK